jgi:Histidine kinase-, DNA gyrase B-, and HSP90-like ATPase/His Kinase A (phospho-acceptor) domain
MPVHTMNPMPWPFPFDRRTARLARRVPVAMTLAGGAREAAAQAPSAVGLIGPWLFACVALVLVAWLGWRAGRRDPAAPSESITRPIEPGPAQTAEHDRSLEALCADLPGSTRLCRLDPRGSDWELLAAHPPLAPGVGALDGLPPAVAFAARSLSAGGSAEVDGWHLRSSGSGPDMRLVVRHADPAPPAGEDPAAFSFTVSHDLRAPLRVVEGFARILKEDYGRQIDRIGNDHLDRVLAAAARMNAMIDAMLSIARLSSQPIARQPVNLSQMAAFVVDDLRRAHPGRQIEATIEPGLHAVGDPTLLRQVLENLLSNAWKYTARCDPAKVSFSATRRDSRQVFEVRDNGAGFDMRSAERLFGLFQRLHSANDFPGTGVGLASVQRIVRRHGGDIWAEAEPGRGACFHFTLGD